MNNAPRPLELVEYVPQENGQGPEASWQERAERTAGAGRAWVAFAADLVGLLFQVLVLGAVAWGLWGALELSAPGEAALQTEQDARVAGRTVNAFLGELSAPVLAALGLGGVGLVLAVVFILRPRGFGGVAFQRPEERGPRRPTEVEWWAQQ